MREVHVSADQVALTKATPPISFRVPFLAVGLLFFPFGLFASAKVVLATIDLFLGRSVEGSFLLGVLIAVIFTGVGAALIWVFFVPTEELVFDGATKSVTSTRRYPFGRTRTDRFPLDDMSLPETILRKHNDSFQEGAWVVLITLPSGRRFEHEPVAHSFDAQRRAAETLRDTIAALM